MPVSLLDPSNFAKKIKIIIIIFVTLFLITTIIYSNIRDISFTDSLILTLETLAYAPPDYINIQERILQVVLMIFGTFVIWFSFWSIMDFVIEGHLYQNIMRWIRMKKINALKDHYIIYGGGRVGEHVAYLLKEHHKKALIVDKDRRLAHELSKKGYLVLYVNENHDQSLLKAGIKKAKSLIITLPKVEDNILVVLSAKELNPKVKIYGRADKLDLVNKLKKAGADHVIVPELAGADIIVSDLLKKKLKKHHLGE